MISTLHWHDTAATLPEPLHDVLLALRGESVAAEGWRVDEREYVLSTGHPIAASEVYAWADLPACPVLTHIRGSQPSALSSQLGAGGAAQP